MGNQTIRAGTFSVSAATLSGQSCRLATVAWIAGACALSLNIYAAQQRPGTPLPSNYTTHPNPTITPTAPQAPGTKTREEAAQKEQLLKYVAGHSLKSIIKRA
jgi:hypothetical protein